MKLQIAQTKHRPGLESLLQSSGLPTSDLPDDLRLFHVAIEGDKLLGSAGIELLGNYGLLRSLAVADDARNRGLGQQLLDAALDIAKSKGVREIYLITTTADRYFEKHGFQRVERASAPPEIVQTQQFAQLCPSSAIVMRQELAE